MGVLVEGGIRRTCAAEDEGPAERDLRLDGVEVERLVELGLEQFAHPADLLAGEGRVRVGEEAMRGVAGGVVRQRPQPFHEGELLEAEVVVDAAQVRASGRPVLVQELPRPVHRAVVVQLDRALDRVERLHRAIDALLEDGVVEVGSRILRVQLRCALELVARRGRPALLVVGLSEVAAQERIVRVQRDRDLDVLPASREVASADPGEPESEPGQRVRRVESDRPLERLCGQAHVHSRQVDEAEHRVRTSERRVRD